MEEQPAPIGDERMGHLPVSFEYEVPGLPAPMEGVRRRAKFMTEDQWKQGTPLTRAQRPLRVSPPHDRFRHATPWPTSPCDIRANDPPIGEEPKLSSEVPVVRTRECASVEGPPGPAETRLHETRAPSTGDQPRPSDSGRLHVDQRQERSPELHKDPGASRAVEARRQPFQRSPVDRRRGICMGQCELKGGLPRQGSQ